MTKEAVLAVLTRVTVGDKSSTQNCVYEAAEALKEYDLTWEEHAALASGDIRKVEE